MTPNCSDAYSADEKYSRAEALFGHVLEVQRRMSRTEHPFTLSCLSDMAFLYQRQGKYQLAETYAAQALAGRRHALGEEDPATMESTADLALVYESQGKFTQSEPLARDAAEFDRKNRPNDWERFRAESVLGASLAEAWGKPEKASKWKQT